MYETKQQGEETGFAAIYPVIQLKFTSSDEMLVVITNMFLYATYF